LGINVVRAVTPIRNSMALRDKPAVEIDAARRAHGDNAAVAVPISFTAGNGVSADLVGESQGRLLPTPVLLPVRHAELRPLRRVDAVEPDALASNLDGVPVDHAGLANDLAVCTRGR